MLNLAIDVAMVVSMAAVLYIVARALPRIDENGGEEKKSSRFLAYLEKGDSMARHWSEKTLRRTRVVVMKFDNFLGSKLSKFRKDGERTGGLKLPLEETVPEEPTETVVVAAETVTEPAPEPAAAEEPEAPAAPKKHRTRRKTNIDGTKSHSSAEGE